jgi:uncharacterized protein YjdB
MAFFIFTKQHKEFQMKAQSVFRLFGIITLVVVIGFTMAACASAADEIDEESNLPYNVIIDMIGNEDGDSVIASPVSGRAGVSITLHYTVAAKAHYNLINFSGVSMYIEPVTEGGNGERIYIINPNDVSGGNTIIIIAKFEHTDLQPDPIAFTDTSSPITKTYGDAAFTNAITNVHNGSGAITYSSDDVNVATVDNDGVVTIYKAGTAIITAYKTADEEYNSASNSYTLTVDPKPVTITGLSATGKVYDRTTTATIIGTAVIDGLVFGDNVTVIHGTAAFESSAAGNNITVTFSGFSLEGTDGGNYTLLAQPKSVTANITAKPVTIIGLSAEDKIHDSTTTATISGTAVIYGLISGDTVIVNYGMAAFESADVGDNVTVIFSGFSLGGKDAGNYTLLAQPENVKAVITDKQLDPIAFTDTSSPITKTYGSATFTNAITNAHNGSGTIVYSSENENIATVNNNGTVTIHKAGTTVITAFKAADTMYAPASRAYTLTVESKPVTIIGLGAANKIHDGTTTATIIGTATISGLINGDTVTVNYGIAVFENANVGNNKTVTFSGFSLGGADAGNYTLSAQPASVMANIEAVAVFSVTLNKSTLTLTEGGTETLTPTISPTNATNKNVNWTSSNTGVAMVSNGTVTAVSAGTAVITVTTIDGSKVATCIVTVTVAVTGVTLDKTELLFDEGAVEFLTPTVLPTNATNKNVNWTSNNTNVATVNNGVVTAVAVGTTTIIVTTADGNRTANCTITVVTKRPIPAMIRIPAGTFTMGSPEIEYGRSLEETQHEVTLSSFYMGNYSVTQAQYQELMGSNPSNYKTSVGGDNPANRPVEMVSWYDALVFCNKLSMRENLTPAYRINNSTDPSVWGTVPTSDNSTWNAVTIEGGSNGYRLPTEEQWEYACRAGTTSTINVTTASVGEVAWYRDNSGTRTHEVGLKLPNAWGLYDMHGNVQEWCLNRGSGSNYNRRVARGGDYYNNSLDLRSARINSEFPYSRINGTGLRLVIPEIIDVTGVTLNKTTVALTAGRTETLIPTVLPTNATNKSVSWTSSDTNVATVNNGTVTAVGAGTATITVSTANGVYKATCAVTVTVAVTGVTLDKDTLSLVGERVGGRTETLTPTVLPTNATNKNVSWTSSNTNVATVENGTVTAVGFGNAIITVTTTDGGKTATCAVTVVAMEMVKIPAGTFMMGGFETTLTQDFYMGKYEVTATLYGAVETGVFHNSGIDPDTKEVLGNGPMASISWYEALVFCNRLSMQEGLDPAYLINGSTNPAAWGAVPVQPESSPTWDAVQIVAGSNGYRLPTYVQWVYACRAGTTTLYNLGNTWSGDWGWYFLNSGSKTHEVGLKLPNAWGLYDMHGNVNEWCWDWELEGSYRMYCGGAYYTPDNGRSLQSEGSSGSAVPAYRASDIGLRLVRPDVPGYVNIPVTNVTLNIPANFIPPSVGETRVLTATVLSTNATNMVVSWTSSDTKVATVNNGIVTAVGIGIAKIFATAGDKTASYDISVFP